MDFSEQIIMEMTCPKCERLFIGYPDQVEMNRQVTCPHCGIVMPFAPDQWLKLKRELNNLEQSIAKDNTKKAAGKSKKSLKKKTKKKA